MPIQAVQHIRRMRGGDAEPSDALRRRSLLVDQIPREWYGAALDELDRLLSRLLERRSLVRDLVLSFKNSSRNPFPNWRVSVAIAQESSLRLRRNKYCRIPLQ